jgi:MSHA biogenesis protein MshP
MCLKPNHAMQNRQGGFSLVSAIFILVILAGLGASMVTFSTAQHSTVAMDIQSARAYQAARAGIEWGAYGALAQPPSVLVPGFTCPASPGSTYAMTFAGTQLSGFATVVTCYSTTHAEGATNVVQSIITSTATYGVANTSDYVARQISARVALCTTPSGTC